jgi:hypothetical protein
MTTAAETVLALTDRMDVLRLESGLLDEAGLDTAADAALDQAAACQAEARRVALASGDEHLIAWALE